MDRLLEATVLGSWSNVGFALRSRAHGWDLPDVLRGRRVLITGGTRGIGRAAALCCAEHGAHVGIVGRDAEHAARIAHELGGAAGTSVWSTGADLSDLKQVRRLAVDADRWASGAVDVLIHCAGALFHEWTAAASGIEMTVATHVVGPHLLTTQLQESLRTSGGVVVWVSSGGMYTQGLELDALEMPPDTFRGAVAYARAKRAQVVLAQAWDAREGDHFRSYSMHPGWVATDALREGLPRFARLARPLLRTPAQGADTAVWLGSHGAPVGAPSGFWLDRQPRATSRWPGPRVPSERGNGLWQWCQRVAGLQPETATS